MVGLLANNVGTYVLNAPGTGNIYVGSAIPGARTPSEAGLVDGGLYSCRSQCGDSGSTWEVGDYTWNDTLGFWSRTSIDASSDSGNPVLLGADTVVQIVARKQHYSSPQEILFSDRVIYVRAEVGAVTFTNGSENITVPDHGLSVDDRVVISIPANTKFATVSNANPAVVTTESAHGLVENQPIKFYSVGYMGPGIDLNNNTTETTTYYVLATGLTATEFQFSTTPGGAAVNNTTQTFTAASGTGSALEITASASHNLHAGQQVAFSNSGGALPTGLGADTPYYVAASPAPTATVFYVSTTNGGTNVAYTDAGTGTHSIEQVGIDSADIDTEGLGFGAAGSHHWVDMAGSMPTFANLPDEGAGYEIDLRDGDHLFVGTVVDADTITLSMQPANAFPIGATTVATGAPAYTMQTGNDGNDGSAQTAAKAYFSIQAALDYAGSINAAGHTLTIQLADSAYQLSYEDDGTGFVAMDRFATVPRMMGQSVVEGLTIQGNSASWRNTQFKAALTCGPGAWVLTKYNQHASTGRALIADGTGSILRFANCDFGSSQTHLYAINGGRIDASVPWAPSYTISGKANEHAYGYAISFIDTTYAGTVHIQNTRGFSSGFASSGNCAEVLYSVAAILGGAVGPKYSATNNGIVSTFHGADYLPGTVAGSTATGGIYE